ncbi:hypothetical protein LshimejAT787_0900540 [Lyophyllum shimeji]|uniref:Fungal-type protein kinase domain-containing protein n=1 Tax=Lyophyllum shimeji TaxID=47721 RepID=A0A9P3UMT9_LYOSH|nr:hypothetical protein LshimejAT787_0900540 [Lyophyllum shimeji]
MDVEMVAPWIGPMNDELCPEAMRPGDHESEIEGPQARRSQSRYDHPLIQRRLQSNCFLERHMQYLSGDAGEDDAIHHAQSKGGADRYYTNGTRHVRPYSLALWYMEHALNNFGDVRELVTAVRDASDVHRQAIALAKVLVCDVSVRNIVIASNDGQTKGFTVTTTGAWQFTAIRLLRKPRDGETPVAERVDSIESFFNVLAWMALRYTAHSLCPEHLSSILRDYFDGSYTAGGKRYVTLTRASYLSSGDIVHSGELANEGIRRVLEYCEGRYAEAANKIYELEVQLRLEALRLLDEDDAWLPNLLTVLLDDEKIAWESNHLKVVRKIHTWRKGP